MSVVEHPDGGISLGVKPSAPPLEIVIVPTPPHPLPRPPQPLTRPHLYHRKSIIAVTGVDIFFTCCVFLSPNFRFYTVFAYFGIMAFSHMLFGVHEVMYIYKLSKVGRYLFEVNYLIIYPRDGVIWASIFENFATILTLSILICRSIA